MRAHVLPLEATFSIRQLHHDKVFALGRPDSEEVSHVIVPPVWLSEEHVARARDLVKPYAIGFSYFLEDVRIENLQKFLQHIHHGDRLLILIDRLPKPQQVEILKRIWQVETQKLLFVTLKEGQDWPFEEAKKSVPWFLRDRVQEFLPDLFFQNELIEFKEKAATAEVPAVQVGWSTQALVHAERIKEEISFRYWCSPHWFFRILRFIGDLKTKIFASLWRLKIPFEYIYWKVVSRVWLFQQLYWLGYSAFGFIKSHIWRLKIPFEFTYWCARHVGWWIRRNAWKLKAPLYFVRAQSWRLRAPYYFVMKHIWKLQVPFHFLRLHLWKIQIPFHYLSERVWKLKIPAEFIYWEIRDRAWRLKIPFYILKANAWKMKLVYWRLRPIAVDVFMQATYPLRKVYWFGSFQYRKRILGEAEL